MHTHTHTHTRTHPPGAAEGGVGEATSGGTASGPGGAAASPFAPAAATPGAAGVSVRVCVLERARVSDGAWTRHSHVPQCRFAQTRTAEQEKMLKRQSRFANTSGPQKRAASDPESQPPAKKPDSGAGPEGGSES